MSEDISCGRGKDVTPFQQGPIISFHQAKKTTKEIAHTTKTVLRTVRCIFKTWKGSGELSSSGKKCGPEKILNDCDSFHVWVISKQLQGSSSWHHLYCNQLNTAAARKIKMYLKNALGKKVMQPLCQVVMMSHLEQTVAQDILWTMCKGQRGTGVRAGILWCDVTVHQNWIL